MFAHILVPTDGSWGSRNSVVHGTLHEVIVDDGDETDAALVVMRTKQRSDEYREFVGSVTRRVADLSSAPVLIVTTGK